MTSLEPRVRQKGVRFYWEPSRKLDALGFKSRPLGNNLFEANGRARRLNAEANAALRGETVAAETKAKQEPRQSMSALINMVFSDSRYLDAAPETQRSLRCSLGQIERRFGHIAVADFDRQAARQIYDDLRRAYSPGTATQRMKVWRSLFNFALAEGWIMKSPDVGLKMPGYEKRSQVWEREDVRRFCAQAVTAGRPSLAIAVSLAYNIGQRPSDIRMLPWSSWTGSHVVLRQKKTRAVVNVRAPAELRSLLETAPKYGVQIVISEETRRPYRENSFLCAFTAIREQAGLAADLQFRDLRRSCVVRLARAFVPVPMIAAVTGHTIASAYQIAATYCPPDSLMADGAIDRLEAFEASTAGAGAKLIAFPALRTE
jgi:integrase